LNESFEILFVHIGALCRFVFKAHCYFRMPLHYQVSYEYFIRSTSILGMSQLDYYFLCQLLTDDTKRIVFLSNVLPKDGIFVNGTCFRFYHGKDF